MSGQDGLTRQFDELGGPTTTDWRVEIFNPIHRLLSGLANQSDKPDSLYLYIFYLKFTWKNIYNYIFSAHGIYTNAFVLLMLSHKLSRVGSKVYFLLFCLSWLSFIFMVIAKVIIFGVDLVEYLHWCVMFWSFYSIKPFIILNFRWCGICLKLYYCLILKFYCWR